MNRKITLARWAGSWATCVAVLLAVGAAGAQDSAEEIGALVGQPVAGELGITETVAQIMERQRQVGEFVGPLRFAEKFKKAYPDRSVLPQNPESPHVAQWPPLDPDYQPREGRDLGPWTKGTNFLGVDSNASGAFPPDTQGAVGPTQVLLALNGRVRVFNKSGGMGGLNVSLDTFFNSVRNGDWTSDPRVRFDRTSDRWFITAINVPDNHSNNRMLIAVSSGPQVNNTSSFTFFYFQHNVGGSTQDNNCFADYPTLGVDANAVYMGDNVFNSTLTQFLGTSAFVIRKSSLLSGGPIVYTAFRRIANGTSGQGPHSPAGPDNDDPNATEGYFVGTDNASFGKLMIRRVSNPGGDPTISANISITVPSTVNPMDVTVLGSGSNKVDAIDDRHFAATIHLNRLTGERNLWLAHHIQVNASGNASGSGGRNGSRWYELQNLTGTPTLKQAGTLFSSAGSSPPSYWFPTVAINGQGHMAIGCTNAGAAQRLEIAFAGRYADDALGVLQSPTVAQTSSSNYNVESQQQRWGDYSLTGVDPADDQSVWTAQEYCSGTDAWGIRIIKLLAPLPATPIACVPASVARGATNVDVVVTGSVVNGSGFYDNDASYVNRMIALVSGTGVTVNSATFQTPTQITLNISVSADAALTARDIIPVNPDGQASSSIGGLLTITDAVLNGACCLSYTCSLLTQAACATAGGSYQGNGTLCTPDPCFCKGDANCDGVVNFDDINPFVDALSGEAPCKLENCDINSDGIIDFTDINPFVDLLSDPPACQ